MWIITFYIILWIMAMWIPGVMTKNVSTSLTKLASWSWPDPWFPLKHRDATYLKWASHFVFSQDSQVKLHVFFLASPRKICYNTCLNVYTSYNHHIQQWFEAWIAWTRLCSCGILKNIGFAIFSVLAWNEKWAGENLERPCFQSFFFFHEAFQAVHGDIPLKP